jgi:hypothetical protein
MSEQSEATLKVLCNKLRRLSQLSTDLLEAVEAGNEAGILEGMYESRVARAAFARTQKEVAAMQLKQTPRAIELLADATELMTLVDLGEEVAKRWLARELPADDVMLQSELGQIFLADAMLPVVWDYDKDLVVLVGCGLEALADKLVAYGQKRLVVYLPEDEESNTGEQSDEYPESVFRARNFDDLTMILRSYHLAAPQRIATRMLPSSGLSDSLQQEIAEHTHDALIDLRVHRNTVVHFAKTWMSQGIANLVHIARSPSIDTLGEAFKGLPVIIVAPGPSLKKNIEYIKKVRSRVLLFAFSHSITPLTRAGIVPDFVLTVDPQDVSYHFDGSDLRDVAAVLNGATVNPRLFELGCPRTITLAANSDLEQWIFGAFGETARAAGGGSVATTALSVALKWGCNPILFCGLDLSFPEGKRYVSTSIDGDARVELDEKGNIQTTGWSKGCDEMRKTSVPGLQHAQYSGVELPGYYGGVVQSDIMFSMFHRWFETTCRHVDEDIQIYNCTEGGCYIEGMKHVPLAEATRNLQDEISATQILDATMGTIDSVGREQTMVTWLRELLEGIDTCLSLAHRCRRMAESFDPQQHEKLQQYERRLMAAVAPLKFVSMLAQPEIEQAIEDAKYATSVEDALQSSVRIFDAIIRTSEWVRPRLQGAVRSLQKPIQVPILEKSP